MAADAPPLPAEGPWNPYLHVWTHPRQTVRRLVETHPDKCVVLFACLTGVGRTLDRASSRNLGDRWDWPYLVIAACVVGPFAGLLWLWLYSHLIRWTGTWIDGTSGRKPIRTAMAWSWVPSIVAACLWIPVLILAGQEMFTEQTPLIDDTLSLSIPLIGIGLVQFVLAIWSIVLLCHAIAEVQGFRSAWKGLLNVFLAGLVVFVPVVLVVVVFVAVG